MADSRERERALLCAAYEQAQADLRNEDSALADDNRKHGFDRPIIVAPFMAMHTPGDTPRCDWGEIDHQCIKLLNRDRSLLQSKGLIPDSYVRKRASFFLRCCYLDQIAPPVSLVRLVDDILVGNQRYGGRRYKKARALDEARRFLGDNPEASDIEISKAAGVDRATAWRWRRDGKLTI